MNVEKHFLLTHGLIFIKTLLLATTLFSPTVYGQDRQYNVHFQKDGSYTDFKGHISNSDAVLYQLKATKHQKMSVTLQTNQRCPAFFVIPPSENFVLFNSAKQGQNFKGILAEEGIYTIRVFSECDLSQKPQKLHYTLKIRITN